MLRRIALILAFSALAWSGTAMALGLGDIELRSALNEPLDAEIELLSVTSEELRSLEVFLAPAATFDRYGLDRPPFLTRIRFDVARTNDGAVVRLTSEAPITEPFVTILVEANWSRGRLLREYTVLLDPPVFAERAAPPPPPQPTAQPAPASQRTVRRQNSTPAAGPSRAPRFDGDTYTVRRGDTLWEIAERVSPAGDLSTNQVMLSLFEANPGAFGGNINLVNAGATLRIPTAAQMRGRDSGSALAEVRRQNSNWRGTTAQSGQNGTLRLLPPDASSGSGNVNTSADGAASGSGSANVAALERELADRERLLAIRDQELADLRRQLAAANAESPAGNDITDTDSESEPAAATSPGVDLTPDPGDEIFVENVPDQADSPADTLAAVDPTDAPAPAETAPAAANETPTPTLPSIPAAEPEPSLVDRAMGLLSNMWTWVALGVAALLLLLPLLARMRRSDDDSTGTWEALDDFEGVDDDSREATSRLRQLAGDGDESIVVVESEKGRTTANLDEALAPAKPAADNSESYAIEDTFSSETAINLDQSDPIAEADFHMAYGLYDQAADLINGAIASDPGRRDLKEKLAEVYFVWGNQDGFVGIAEKLREQIGDVSDEGWDKIRIMGQQIAPAHALFSGEAPAAALESVDLDFADETGAGMDLDFAVEDEGSAELLGVDGSGTSANDGGGLDFEFSATGAHDADAVDLDPGQFFAAEDGPTVERDAGNDDDSPTVERLVDDDPTVERPMDDGAATQETPTIESPAVGASNDAPRTDETAEIDLDDLGLDLAGLDETNERSAIVDMSDIDELNIDSSIETLGIGSADSAEADETLGIGGAALGEADETLSQPSSGDSVTVLAPGTPASNDAGEDTMLAPVDINDSLIASAADETLMADEFAENNDIGVESTGRVPVISGDDLDLDLDDLTAALQKTDFANMDDAADATIERPLASAHQSDLEEDVMADSLGGDLDLDIGMDVQDDDDAPTANRAEAGDQEPDNRTMTEVGTKLDLARAYIDMGDPDGARSILREVADEGSSAQQQEARKLLDDLAS